jgi:hypothetical protein
VHSGRVGALASLLEGPGRFLTGRRVEGVAPVCLQTIWSANSTGGALLGEMFNQTGRDEYLIWDEAQTEVAGEADVQIRRAEMTRLIRLGRHDEAQEYLASPEAGMIRMVREGATPRTAR